VRIDPVEIALPKGVGYTLRAYRSATEVTPTDISEREEDAFPERHRPIVVEEPDEFADDEFDEDEGDLDEDELDDEDAEEDEDDEDDELDDDEEEEDEEEADEDAAAAAPDEIPVFLGRAGKP